MKGIFKNLVSISTSVTLLASPFLAVLPIGAQVAGAVEFCDNSVFALQWGTPGAGNGEFDQPIAIATTPSGVSPFAVYVVDPNYSRVQRFDANGNFQLAWGSTGTGPGQFSTPVGITVDNLGRVYVTDANNHRVQRFDADGNFQLTWGSHGFDPGQFNGPWGVVAAGGSIFISQGDGKRVQRFDPDGAFIQEWGSYGSGNDQFGDPRGLAANESVGHIYVADRENNRVSVFNYSGVFQYQVAGGFNSPFGVETDASGSLYVVDQQNHRVRKYEGTTLLRQWGSEGTGNGQFSWPVELAVDENYNVYVADTQNNRIQKFSCAPAPTPTPVPCEDSSVFIGAWGTEGSGDNELSSARGLAFDGAHNVYIADTFNHRIQKFDSNGNPVNSFAGGTSNEFGSPGAGNGQFDRPFDVTVDAAGNIYVVEQLNNRVQKFDSAGNYLTQWGSAGSALGQFNNPLGIVAHASGIYVADSDNNRIQKFDSNGGSPMSFSGGGLSGSAVDVAVNSTGTVYALSYSNHAIYAYNSAGVFQFTFGASQLIDARKLGIDAADNIYVNNVAQGAFIRKYSSTGTLLQSWLSQYWAISAPDTPDLLNNAVDAVGVDGSVVYVIDNEETTGQVVKKFGCGTTPTPTPTPTPAPQCSMNHTWTASADGTVWSIAASDDGQRVFTTSGNAGIASLTDASGNALGGVTNAAYVGSLDSVFHPDGKVYTVKAGSSMQVFTPPSSNTSVAVPASLKSIDVGPDNLLYALDYTSGNIVYALTTSGALDHQFAVSGTGIAFALTVDSNGAVVIAWSDQTAVYVNRYTTAGAPIGGTVYVGPDPLGSLPDIAASDTGKVWVTDGKATLASGVVYEANGLSSGDVVRQATVTTNTGQFKIDYSVGSGYLFVGKRSASLGGEVQRFCNPTPTPSDTPTPTPVPPGAKDVITLTIQQIGKKKPQYDPASGSLVRVYASKDPAFIAAYGNDVHPSEYQSIFNADVGFVAQCTTNSDGVCTAYEPEPAKYLVIARYLDDSEDKTVYIAGKKNAKDFKLPRPCRDDKPKHYGNSNDHDKWGWSKNDHDHDGWKDNDKNRDGYDDDDNNRDGWRDSDRDRNGYDDDDDNDYKSRHGDHGWDGDDGDDDDDDDGDDDDDNDCEDPEEGDNLPTALLDLKLIKKYKKVGKTERFDEYLPKGFIQVVDGIEVATTNVYVTLAAILAAGLGVGIYLRSKRK